jgi:hypothetical protein
LAMFTNFLTRWPFESASVYSHLNDLIICHIITHCVINVKRDCFGPTARVTSGRKTIVPVIILTVRAPASSRLVHPLCYMPKLFGNADFSQKTFD